MKTLTMLHVLFDIQDNVLPHLLFDGGEWNSLDITYEKPFVHRLWRQYGEYRILLHEIQPCHQVEALYHPHRGPSAVHVYGQQGVGYEMGVGYGPGPRPPIAATMRIAGPSSFTYEMLEPFAWHYVRPIDGSTLSLMVMGKPWTDAIQTRETAPMGPLTPHIKSALLEKFQFLHTRPLLM